MPSEQRPASMLDSSMLDRIAREARLGQLGQAGEVSKRRLARPAYVGQQGKVSKRKLARLAYVGQQGKVSKRRLAIQQGKVCDLAREGQQSVLCLIWEQTCLSRLGWRGLRGQQCKLLLDFLARDVPTQLLTKYTFLIPVNLGKFTENHTRCIFKFLTEESDLIRFILAKN